MWLPKNCPKLSKYKYSEIIHQFERGFKKKSGNITLENLPKTQYNRRKLVIQQEQGWKPTETGNRTLLNRIFY